MVLLDDDTLEIPPASHTALMHLAEGVARLAARDITAADRQEAAAYAGAVLDRAARALAAKLPALLSACQAEPAAMRRAASLARCILQHCAASAQGHGGGACAELLSGQAVEATTETLKAAFLRQPDPEALEHIAECLAYLLDLGDGARPVVRDLTSILHKRFLKLVPGLTSARGGGPGGEPPPADALLSTATRLRILAKAFDVSLCNLRTFGAVVLELLDGRGLAAAEGREFAIGPQLVVTLLELFVLILIRHATAFLQPQPLARCVVHDPIDAEQLQLAPTAAEDLCTVILLLLKSDPDPHVRTASFASAVALLTAWWNISVFAHAAAGPGKPLESWLLPLSEELSRHLSLHLGELLTEANMVPVDAGPGVIVRAPEPGNFQSASAVSQIFTVIHRGFTADISAGSGRAKCEQVRVAVLICALVAACRHPEVAESNIPALVLSQALSSREDLQEAAWLLVRRLRKEAHWQAENVEAFFSALLRAVQVVHQDASPEVARDLSYRLLQHVGVGKLAPVMQVGLVTALRAGVVAALSPEAREGLLLALVPWVTKHVVEDDLLREVAAWAEDQAVNTDGAGRAGLPTFIEACHATTARRSERSPPAAPPAADIEDQMAAEAAPLAIEGCIAEVDAAAPVDSESDGDAAAPTQEVPTQEVPSRGSHARAGQAAKRRRVDSGCAA